MKFTAVSWTLFVDLAVQKQGADEYSWIHFSHFCSCVSAVGQTERRDSTLLTLYIHSIFSSSAAFQHWSSTASLCTELLKHDLMTAALTVYSQLTNVPIIPHLAFTIFHSTTRSCCLLLSRILIGFCFMHKVFFLSWKSHEGLLEFRRPTVASRYRTHSNEAAEEETVLPSGSRSLRWKPDIWFWIRLAFSAFSLSSTYAASSKYSRQLFGSIPLTLMNDTVTGHLPQFYLPYIIM